MREQELTVTLAEQYGEGLMVVPVGNDLHVRVRLESVHEGIYVSTEVDTEAVGQCGRCLDEFTQPVEVEFQELFAYSSDEASESEVHDDHVDLEPLIRDAVVLSLPFQPVCRPDCAGLDPETGERLAEMPDNELRDRVDPRWSALAGFTTDQGAGNPAAGYTEER
ncbi:YceD family protein [Mycetocola spongiae]|uniref:YceD family protein n=1 Tax=Mycetocola spongiae TaxID=2859226 RepID=UPI001CF2B2D1|nr:DUF177 domain-containing protein [Mycetocola spongiae]UCR90423.1 DUF177 domain-containing protein [Mycetocola spongiae]